VSGAAIAWTVEPPFEAAAKADLVEAGRLVDRLREDNAAGATGKIALLMHRAADPRVGGALVRLCADPPFHATGSQPFWRQVFTLLDANLDPRMAESLAYIPGALSKIIKGASQRGWMQDRLKKARAAVAARWPKPPALPAADAKLARSIELAELATAPAPRPKPSGTAVADLYRAVYEHPEDDGARAVLADKLVEKGDPRGTFIALQLARKGRGPTEAERKQEMALLVPSQRAWLGAIAPVIPLKMRHFIALGPETDRWDRDTFSRWERGFLAGCALDVKGPTLKKIASSPLFSTVERVRGMPEPGRDMRAGVAELLAGMRAVRSIGASGQLLAMIAETPIAARLEQLVFRGSPEAADWKIIEGLPKLRFLGANVVERPLVADAIAAVVGSRLFRERLEEVRFEGQQTLALSHRPGGAHHLYIFYPDLRLLRELAGVLPVKTIRSMEIETYDPQKRQIDAVRALFPQAKDVTVTKR
jgi:uncharacterized protein (TIGR02996 family)